MTETTLNFIMKEILLGVNRTVEEQEKTLKKLEIMEKKLEKKLKEKNNEK